VEEGNAICCALGPSSVSFWIPLDHRGPFVCSLRPHFSMFGRHLCGKRSQNSTTEGRRSVANKFANARVLVSSSMPWAALWNPRGALSPSFHSASKPWSTRSLRRDTSNKQKQDSIPLKSLQTDVVKERRSKVRLEPGSATDIGTHRPCHILDTNPLSLVWVLPDSSLSLPQVICVVPNFLRCLRIVYALPEF
jgi:hypothetical protein